MLSIKIKAQGTNELFNLRRTKTEVTCKVKKKDLRKTIKDALYSIECSGYSFYTHEVLCDIDLDNKKFKSSYSTLLKKKYNGVAISISIKVI